jgi:hypothetical protein
MINTFLSLFRRCVLSTFLLSGFLVPTSLVQAAESAAESLLSLEVIDSFVEVRTGPGRGYPVFYVIEQGERVDVLTRRTDWYEVKSESGKVGWATSAQLSRTLQASGEPADLPTVSFGDYQKNNWRVGFAAGEFSNGELEGSDTFSATASYRFFSWGSLEGEWGKVFSSGTAGDFYSLNVLLEPFSRWRFSPELIVGRGKLSLGEQPNLTALGGSDSSFTNYGLGLNYYLGRNFVIRGEYLRYSVSTDNDKVNLDSWKIGFNTFF